MANSTAGCKRQNSENCGMPARGDARRGCPMRTRKKCLITAWLIRKETKVSPRGPEDRSAFVSLILWSSGGALLPLHPAGLEAVEGVAGSQVAGERGVRDHVAARGVHEEERPPGAGGLERHQRTGRGEPSPLLLPRESSGRSESKRRSHPEDETRVSGPPGETRSCSTDALPSLRHSNCATV